MSRPLLALYAAVALNAVGIGLVFPILPSLLEEVGHGRDAALALGALAALYALMQFVFAPMLGALSDRLGRRPVLLASLAGAAVDYVFLAAVLDLWMLFVGRAVAGLTGATGAVAAACLTDVSAPADRPRLFGILNAMFGLGFVVGPVLGGVLGEQWVRLPFVAAAALNGGTLILALLSLPETRTGAGGRIELAALNPLRPLRWAASLRGVLPVVAAFFVLAGAGEAYGVAWALWGHDAFGWSETWVGLSLGAFGFCQALAQAVLPGPAVRILGERPAILLGLGSSATALVALAFATRTWVVFAVMPLFALGGIGVPALQALASRQVAEDRQGQFQGVLASAVSLASVAAPLGFVSFYALVRDGWPGAVWLSVVVAQAVGAIIVLRLRFGGIRPVSA